MKVLIAFNPVAGKGLAAVSARAICDHLDGHRLGDGRTITAFMVKTQIGPLDGWIGQHLEDADLLVAIGGDGAVRMLAPAAIRASIPLYHYPTGTENLFAREYGMSAHPDRLLQSIQEGRIIETDVAEIEGSLSLLCASLGFDADVVHDLASRRSGPISHLSYVKPILRSLLSWRRAPSLFSIAIDGGDFSEPRGGVLVIANSSQYALRMDPALNASSTDGALDVVFLPAKNVLHLICWAIRCRLKRHLRHSEASFGRGAVITVQCAPKAQLQIDGDAFRPGEALAEVEARIGADKLLVLAPSSEKSPISKNRP